MKFHLIVKIILFGILNNAFFGHMLTRYPQKLLLNLQKNDRFFRSEQITQEV